MELNQNTKKVCFCCKKKLSYDDIYVDNIYINNDKSNKIFLCSFCHEMIKNIEHPTLTNLKKVALPNFVKSNFGICSLFQDNQQENMLTNLKTKEDILPKEELSKKQAKACFKCLFGISGIIAILNISKMINISAFILIFICMFLFVLIMIGFSECRFIKIIKKVQNS